MSSTPEPTRQPVRRPGWVWVISIFYVVSIGFNLLSWMWLLSNPQRLTPAQQAYFAALGPVWYISSIGLSLLALTANVLLFALRKAAVPLFTANFFLTVGLTLVHAFTSNWSQALPSGGVVGLVIGWGILGAVTLYSRHLRQVGVLG